MAIKLDFNNRAEVCSLIFQSFDPEYFFSIGIEVGALESFFSFENSLLGNSTQKDAILVVDNSSWKYDVDVYFETAKIHVSERGLVDERGGMRNLTIKSLNNSFLMDSVIRFVIPKAQVKEARIGDRLIQHKGRNRYHQFPAESVQLSLNSGATLSFFPVTMNLPQGFSPVVYLRDEPNDWILHFRALALAPSQFMLKGCSRWYNRPLPPGLQRLIFWAFPDLRRKLLYVRERFSQRIPLQVNGASLIESEGVMQMTVRWVVEDAC